MPLLFGPLKVCEALCVCSFQHLNIFTVPNPGLQIRPLAEAFKFGNFFSPVLSESDFDAKPSVLLLGQYSTGNTQYLNPEFTELKSP